MRSSFIALLLALASQAWAADPQRRFSIVGTSGDPPVADFSKDSGLNIQHVESASVEEFKILISDGSFKTGYVLSVVLTEGGAELNKQFTDSWIDKRIAVIVDDVVISLPMILVPSERDFVVSAPRDMSRDDVEQLAKRLQSDNGQK